MNYLVIAGFFSTIAALMHIGIILGGASWYRFFGAGEHMAQMAEQKVIKPTIITSCIASILFIWALYAFSGAGLIFELPFLKYGLLCITLLYSSRGILGLVLICFPDSKVAQENSRQFWIYSSLICLFIGTLHAKGTYAVWQVLKY